MSLELDLNRTLGSFVAERASRARVFERFGLDYCCGGKKPLADACQEKSINPREVLNELYEDDHQSAKMRRIEEHANWADASLSDLVDHIQRNHHQYMRTEMPRILELARKVAKRHGEGRESLVILADTFGAFAEQMTAHMMKEDSVLFPMVKQVDQATSELPRLHCGSLNNPVRVMEFEHEEAGAMLQRFRQLTDDYTLPEQACNSYRALFAALQEMETDLHMHVHEENNVLFPKVLAKERSLQEKCCR